MRIIEWVVTVLFILLLLLLLSGCAADVPNTEMNSGTRTQSPVVIPDLEDAHFVDITNDYVAMLKTRLIENKVKLFIHKEEQRKLEIEIQRLETCIKEITEER